MRRKNDEIFEISEILYSRTLFIFQKRKKSFDQTKEKIRNIERHRNIVQPGFDSITEFKCIGGDYVWQTWLGTKTTQLHQEMAINAALMIEAHENVRQDFAKLEAIKKILTSEKSTRVRKQYKDESDMLQSLGLLR